MKPSYPCAPSSPKKIDPSTSIEDLSCQPLTGIDLIHMDALTWMAARDDHSIHAIVTDPPPTVSSSTKKPTIRSCAKAKAEYGESLRPLTGLSGNHCLDLPSSPRAIENDCGSSLPHLPAKPHGFWCLEAILPSRPTPCSPPSPFRPSNPEDSKNEENSSA